MVFPTVVIRPDNAQAISKLAEFLINLGPNYLKAMDYNFNYLVLNKYLTIKYKVKNKDSGLINITNKIFTTATNALYENNPDKRSGKGHIFKLFKGVVN